ncbi:MAG: MBL fold metallo-hydrolase, partial [Bacteroidales bacterium]|nr:MBL fold metallo-hydrolase [Bacteroidales bacterium]
MKTAEFTFLGTGTSQGVPMIGCHCEVCRSDNPKNKRLRTAGLIRFEDKAVAIDAGPNFREQMLSAGVDRLDAILLTHPHRDHIGGLDDVRPYN